MAKMTIWDWIALQRGAQLAPKTATTLGQSIGAQPNRGVLLAQLMSQGKIKTEQLSPEDTKAAGANLDKGGGGSLGFVGKAVGGVGGFFENLGSDAWKATKGFVPGLVEAGTSAVQDVTNLGMGLAGLEHGVGATSLSKHDAPKFGENVKENVIDPQLQYYNQQYLTGNPIRNFYEHPLGPILDVATVASLGSGGAARAGAGLSNAGKISAENPLARLGSTQGRPALTFDANLPEGVAGREIPRNYSSRPLRKGLQIATDKLGERIAPIQGMQRWQARTFDQKMGAARKDSQALQQVNRQVSQLIPVLKDLSPEEFQAFDLVTRGINSPGWLAEYERAVQGSMRNELPEGANASDFGRIVDDPRLAESRANLSPEVKALAVDPAQSDSLMAALQSYYNTVDERITKDMDPEHISTKANELRDALVALRGEGTGVGGTPEPDHPLEPMRDEAGTPDTGTPVARDEPQTNNETGSTFAEMHRIDQSKFYRAAEEEGIYIGDLINDEKPKIPEDFEPPEVKAARAENKGLTARIKEENITMDRSNPLWAKLFANNKIIGNWTKKKDDERWAALPETTRQAIAKQHRDARRASDLYDFKSEISEGLQDEGYDVPEVELQNMRRLEKEESAGYDQAADLENTPPHSIQLGPNKNHPFPDPTIAPVQVARDFKWNEPGKIGQAINYVRGIDNTPGFQKQQGQFSPSNVTYQNVLQQPFNTYKPNANPLLAGVHRPDPRSFVDLISKHERDVVEQAYSAEMLDKWALKGPDGEPVTVMSDYEAQSKYGKGYTAVHPTAPLHYYNDQTTVAQMVAYMEDNGFPVDGPEMRAAVEAIGEDTVVKMTQAARKQKALVIPRSVAEYQRKIENASKPYENPAIRGMARALNVWRTYTLSLMPRWALNTAVGSFMLNTIKGVGPKDYALAGKLHKGEPGEANIFESPEMGGVQLGNQVGMEIAELGMQGGTSGTNRLSRASMEKVQSIEDYFRRASMVHSLRKEAQQGIRENGTIIAGFERDKGPRTTDEFTDLILNDPKLVRRALDDVDRFAYNFAALGPFERRVVRQIAPFWGWYRFITGVVYRLPVDYPGRANVISSLGNIGMQHNEKFGEMPRWLQGNVLKAASGGKIDYFGTSGINVFGSFLNPGSPEGISGVAQLGQASPLIQAFMAAYGIDPMSGGQLAISPEHGVSPDFTGTLRDEKTGEEREVGSVAPFQRALATLIRAFPEARIGERIHSGGRAPYPESIPLIAEYYRNTKPENRYGSGIMEALAQMTGTAVRPFDLQAYQSFRAKGMDYARKKGARDRAKLKAKKK